MLVMTAAYWLPSYVMSQSELLFFADVITNRNLVQVECVSDGEG
jgi:HJR/Mrr/RecB family endonuclease